jgi:hypothetical protein
MNILRDMTGKNKGDMSIVGICHECNLSEFPNGKPILPNDINAQKNEKGNWVCGSCNEESINKMLLRNLGPDHPKVKTFVIAEDKRVLQHNTAAKRLNDKAHATLMLYKRNRYTGRMLLPSS